MKNRIFFQLNPLWQILSLLLLAMSVFLVYGCAIIVVNTIFDNAWDLKILIILVILVFVILFCFYTFLRFEHLRIAFREHYIFVPDDWMWEQYKIQYKTKIDYSEITEIKLIRSSSNSIDKKITGHLPSSGVLKPYIEITCKNGKKKRIFVMYFTKYQLVKIVDEIKTRMIQCGNNNPIGNSKNIVEELPKGGVII